MRQKNGMDFPTQERKIPQGEKTDRGWRTLTYPDWTLVVEDQPKATLNYHTSGHLVANSQNNSITFSLPLTSLPTTYFEIVLEQLNDGCVTIGFGPENSPPTAIPGQSLNSFGYSTTGQVLAEGRTAQMRTKRKKDSPAAHQGDRIGCGLSKNNNVFFTKNLMIFKTEFKWPNNSLLFPIVHCTKQGTTLSFEMNKKNPHPSGASLFKINPNAPLRNQGTLDCSHHIIQSAPIFSIPREIFKTMIHLFSNPSILQSCKTFYELLSPLYTWIQAGTIQKELHRRKYYQDLRRQYAGEPPCVTHIFQLNEDGTFISKQASHPGVTKKAFYGSHSLVYTQFEGHWKLVPKTRQGRDKMEAFVYLQPALGLSIVEMVDPLIPFGACQPVGTERDFESLWESMPIPFRP